jgi:hypothetical protein
MRTLRFITLLALTTLCLPLRGNAQTPSTTPLYLFTTGSGQISPFTNGEPLTVGQTYELQAIPDPGSEFSDWRHVNVFFETQYLVNTVNNTTNILISEIPSPGPVYSSQPILDFTMQPETVIIDNPGSLTITESQGWQADFVATPEPPTVALIASGLMAFVLLLRTRFRSGRDLPL